MAGGLKSYNLKKVVATFGAIIFSGFAEDDAITLTPEANIFDSKIGADGQTSRSRSNNDNYKATVRFMATSDARAQLQDATFRNAALSGLTLPFRLYSPDTGEEYSSAQAYVEKLPDASFGREVSEREYTLYLPDCKVSVREVLLPLFGIGG
jgi:hypothetical protein